MDQGTGRWFLFLTLKYEKDDENLKNKLSDNEALPEYLNLGMKIWKHFH